MKFMSREKSVCEKCGKAVKVVSGVSRKHLTNFLTGFPVLILDSTEEQRCSVCHSVVAINYRHGENLAYTAILARIHLPLQLSPEEIRGIRKCLMMDKGIFAKTLNTTTDMVEKWERQAFPLSPVYDRVLRMIVGYKTYQKAPLVKFRPRKILTMKITPFRKSNEDIVAVRLVKYVESYEGSKALDDFDEFDMAYKWVNDPTDEDREVISFEDVIQS